MLFDLALRLTFLFCNEALGLTLTHIVITVLTASSRNL
jgi:hypothetical protein